MKRLASAILLLIASTMATAADPQVGENKSLVLAYNANAAEESAPASEREEAVSAAQTDRVMRETLSVVSASLAYELDSRIASNLALPK